jgi:hypothetical protein
MVCEERSFAVSNLSEQYDARQIHSYVVRASDEFGKQKWGMGGGLFKGKNYTIYHTSPRELAGFGTRFDQIAFLSIKRSQAP